MAEINTATTSKRKGGTKSKKLSTRVDLTPMVDLGFLLITFFIFTTTLSQPRVMKLALPKDDINNPMPTAESKTISIILNGDNKLCYYNGDDVLQMRQTDFKNIRDIIIKKQQEVAEKFHDKKEIVVLIKPSDASTYKNFIDIMDEMLINNITRPIVTDESKDEAQYIAGHFK